MKTKEIIVRIIGEGINETRLFDTCEKAWQWERNKAKAYKRKTLISSYLVGCTSTGRMFGGILRVNGQEPTREYKAYMRENKHIWRELFLSIEKDLFDHCIARGFEWGTVEKESLCYLV